MDGGEPERLTNKSSNRAAFSPDGTSLACGYLDAAEWKIAIIPIGAKEPSRLIDVPQRTGFRGNAWTWAPDGRAFIYSDSQNRVGNLWRLPLDGGKPTQITNFTAESLPELALSQDSKHFAFTRGHSTLDVVLIKDAK